MPEKVIDREKITTSIDRVVRNHGQPPDIVFSQPDSESIFVRGMPNTAYRKVNDTLLSLMQTKYIDYIIESSEVAAFSIRNTHYSHLGVQEKPRGIRRLTRVFEKWRDQAETKFSRYLLHKLYRWAEEDDQVRSYLALGWLGFLKNQEVPLDPFISEQLERIQPLIAQQIEFFSKIYQLPKPSIK